MEANHANMRDWQECIRILLIGNGVITNLAEPDIQIKELLPPLDFLKKALQDPAMADDRKKLLRDELMRQRQYLEAFRDLLSTVVGEYAEMTTEESNHGRITT